MRFKEIESPNVTWVMKNYLFENLPTNTAKV